MKSGKFSMRSYKSVHSTKSTTGDVQFEDHLNKAFKKYHCPYAVSVKKEYLGDEFKSKIKKNTIAAVTIDVLQEDSSISSDKISATTSSEYENTIQVTAVYNDTNNLLEIILNNIKFIPRELIKSISSIIPFYEHFAKISIQKCSLDGYIISDISKLLPVSTITDLCFDGSPFKEANYAILLETKTSLSSLSLSRCKINDVVCEQIASKLYTLTPSESRLKTLNLSSNHITNVGAKHISEALRSNRHLRYLNLADNHIDDEGAAFIFDTLKEFPMTSDEITSKRQRFIEYLKLKQDFCSKYLHEITNTSIDATNLFSRKTVKKNYAPSLKTKSDKKVKEKIKMVSDDLSTKAELFAADIMGPFHDPFNPDNIKTQYGYTWCIGNMVLCYLNLSYNNLSYLSTKKLQDVLIYQSECNQSNQSGLIRVLIEGNAVPAKCDEMYTISNLLAESVVSRVQFNNTSKRKTGRQENKSQMKK